jgi:tellurium resistance protein TerZ
MADVNLRKLPRVNLSKNQVVCLTKDGSENSSKLGKVYFGSNWSAIKHYSPVGFIGKLFGKSSNATIENVDLDSSILIYDRNLRLIDKVCYYNLVSKCGAIRHSGDDTTGDVDEDDTDNETISINLDNVNINAKFLVVILNSYRHHKFNEIPYAGLRIYTGRLGNPDEVLASYRVNNNPEFKGKEAMILGYFYKSPTGWKFKADGTATTEKSIDEISMGSAIQVLSNDNF